MFSPMFLGSAALSGSTPSLPITLKRILQIGDSTTYGVGANPSGVAGVVGAHIDSPARQLARKLTAAGYSANSNSVTGMGNNSFASSTEDYFNRTPDVSVTLNSWTDLGFDSIGGDIYQCNTIDSPLVFTFDNVDKGALGLPIRTYGISRYRIDAGSWIIFSQNKADHEGVDSLARLDLDFGSLGNHTVEVEYVSGATIYTIYCEAWDSSSNFVVVPWGARGYTSTQLNDSSRPWSYKSALSYVPFDALIYNAGINDVRSGGAGTSQAVYEQNVTDFVNAAKAANPDAVVFLQIPNDISTGLSYIPTSLTNLATILNCVLLDTRLATDMNTYANANSAGLMYDSLHPNNLGYSNQYDPFTPIVISNLT